MAMTLIVYYHFWLESVKSVQVMFNLYVSLKRRTIHELA